MRKKPVLIHYLCYIVPCLEVGNTQKKLLMISWVIFQIPHQTKKYTCFMKYF